MFGSGKLEDVHQREVQASASGAWVGDAAVRLPGYRC